MTEDEDEQGRSVSATASLSHVDMLIGTEGTGSEYGGMMPYACVPFGSFHLVPVWRIVMNRLVVSRLADSVRCGPRPLSECVFPKCRDAASGISVK